MPLISNTCMFNKIYILAAVNSTITYQKREVNDTVVTVTSRWTGRHITNKLILITQNEIECISFPCGKSDKLNKTKGDNPIYNSFACMLICKTQVSIPVYLRAIKIADHYITFIITVDFNIDVETRLVYSSFTAITWCFSIPRSIPFPLLIIIIITIIIKGIYITQMGAKALN